MNTIARKYCKSYDICYDESGGQYMIITATELKTNLGKYLDMIVEEDILITKNGKIIAKLSQPDAEKIAILKTLVGYAKGVQDDTSLDEIKSERLSKK